ncbi:MAG: cupin domain-containing protein [Elusimicrobia bacterium]|nr:cupin domain-containing protein [Elusimicrobiota bacterium]
MSKERADDPNATLVRLERPFLDDRGAIQPLVERTMRSALVISSKKGAVRGNHYHRTDWHYCYVVSGVMYYFHRPTGSLARPERVIVKPGSMVFTPPRVDHAMEFPKNTVFLTLSRNPRDQTAYEKDVIRVALRG